MPFLVDSYELGEDRGAGDHDVIRKDDAEILVAADRLSAEYGVPEAEGSVLPQVNEVCQL